MNKKFAFETFCTDRKQICKLTKQRMSFKKCFKCSAFAYTTTENALIYKGDIEDIKSDLDEDYIAYGGDMGDEDDIDKIKIWEKVCRDKIFEVKKQ